MDEGNECEEFSYFEAHAVGAILKLWDNFEGINNCILSREFCPQFFDFL